MAVDSTQTPATHATRVPTRWRESIYVRVILLCVVLLCCLLGVAGAMAHHFFTSGAEEIRKLGDDVMALVQEQLAANPDMDPRRLGAVVREEIHADINIEIKPNEAGLIADTWSLDSGPDGLTRRGQIPVSSATQQLVIILSSTTAAQTEILRAFRNRYLVLLSGVFLLTLGLMVYFIHRAMRPLVRLSETCAAITRGNLRSVSTRGATGEVRALEVTFNDMVRSLQEKEVMEGKLRQAQRVSALGNLAAGVAHDVRNPLNAIKLLSSHAVDSLGDRPEARQVSTIRREVDRLEEIVSNFLSLAKETDLSPEPNRMDALLEECLRLFQKDAEERQVQLVSELRAGDTTLMLDAKHWTRAILNVLLNALEATPPGGRVRLFSRVTVSACEVEIRDDGPGLPRETIERVFDPYYTTKPGGTGLGLSITRGIVEEHGGTIEMTGMEGSGCQVVISLPLDTTKAP